MEATISYAPPRPNLAMGADPLSAFSLSSPRLSQETPRFAGDRPSPTTLHLRDSISSSSSQRSYSNGSAYFASVQSQGSPHHRPYTPQVDVPWSTERSYSANPVSARSITAKAEASTVSAEPATTASASWTQTLTQPVHPEHQQQVGQMSVSLNHQVVSLGGQTSLGHSSLGSSPPLGHSETHHHHWNPSRSLYTASTESYSARNSPSPTGTSYTVSSAHYTPAMSSNQGGVSGDALGRSPNPHQQLHNDSSGNHARADNSSSSNHDSSSTNAHNSNTHGSASSRNSPNPGSLLTFRSQHSPSIPSIGMPSLTSKLGTSLPILPSQSNFQIFQHQHGLPSPTLPGNAMRLIPPPLPSQASLSGLAPSHYGNHATSPGGAGNSNASRAYPYHQHHQGASSSPHSPGLSGSVLSSMSSTGGQLALMGLPYGASSGHGGPGGGVSSYALSGGGRRSLLYSHGQGALHSHLSPSSQHQHMGHHHLPGLMSGKGGGNPGIGLMIGVNIGGTTGASMLERPFKCDQCPQAFNRNHDLKRHKRIHLAVKPFPCNFCDKSFSRKDALKRHRLVKGCGESQPSEGRNSHDGTPQPVTAPPAGSSVLSDTTSDGGGTGAGQEAGGPL